MPLSTQHQKLLQKYQSNPSTGLTQTQTQSSHSYNDTTPIPSPINCPSWVCCLLPCLKHVPSMKLFHLITPEDAEVFRDSMWVCYDASSVLPGDLIRLQEGDRIPADCIVLQLGMEWEENDYHNHHHGHQKVVSSLEELLVDVSDITGEERPRVASIQTDGCATCTKLLYGGMVLQGSCVAIVTNVGGETVLANLIREKRWPPTDTNQQLKGDEYVSLVMGSENDDNDDAIDHGDEEDERGVALTNR